MVADCEKDGASAAYIAAANPAVVLALIEKIERLEEDFDAAARNAADESVKAVRLEEEADWLAKEAARMDRELCEGNACPYTHENWRTAAREAVAERAEQIDIEPR